MLLFVFGADNDNIILWNWIRCWQPADICQSAFKFI